MRGRQLTVPRRLKTTKSVVVRTHTLAPGVHPYEATNRHPFHSGGAPMHLDPHVVLCRCVPARVCSAHASPRAVLTAGRRRLFLAPSLL